MKVRKGFNGGYIYGSSKQFNTHGIGEVVVYYDDDCSSEFIKDLEVEIPNEGWFSMEHAFEKRYIVCNNLNTEFGLPTDEAARLRGYNW